MIRSILIAIVQVGVLITATIPTTQADSTIPQITGKAYDRENGTLLYTEYYFCDADHLQCDIEYRDIVGELIAQKQLDYSLSPYRPSLVMKDYRQQDEFSFDFSSREDLVVDAGFDNFVRSNWPDLIAGETVNFPFLVLGFNRPIDMRARELQSTSCNPEVLCLEIEVDSWLLGLLADPIELVYSRQDRKLLRFQGVSNIKGLDGEALNVQINYQYNVAHRPAQAVLEQVAEAYHF